MLYKDCQPYNMSLKIGSKDEVNGKYFIQSEPQKEGV